MKAKTVRQMINSFIHVSGNREERTWTYWTSGLHLQSSQKCTVRSRPWRLLLRISHQEFVTCHKPRALATATVKKTWKCKVHRNINSIFKANSVRITKEIIAILTLLSGRLEALYKWWSAHCQQRGTLWILQGQLRYTRINDCPFRTQTKVTQLFTAETAASMSLLRQPLKQAQVWRKKV